MSIRAKLKKFKECLDWIENFEGKLTAHMGICYTGVASKNQNTTSEVEKAVVRCKKGFDEYQSKLKYIRPVERAIMELTGPERKIIEMKFNLKNKKSLKSYKIGQVPDWIIYESEEFRYGKTKYYEIKKSAYRKLEKNLC